MDPAWYVGQVTRGAAESCLRRVNRVRHLCIWHLKVWFLNFSKYKCHSWYQVKKVNLLKCALCQDGTFLVRDSSNRSSNQPYTLVVLYQDKVFNIQIRTNHNGFMLGTGLKSSEVLKLVFVNIMLLATCIMTNVCNTIVSADFWAGQRHYQPAQTNATPSYWCQEPRSKPTEPVCSDLSS